MNSSDRNDKPLAIVGLATVVVYLGAFGLTPPGSPNSASSGAQIVRYATAHRDQLLASYLLFAVGVPLLMIFAAGLYRLIRRAERATGWLAIASLATVIAGAGTRTMSPSVRSTSDDGRYSLIATGLPVSSNARYTIEKPPRLICRSMR